jgi:hypothetical protein
MLQWKKLPMFEERTDSISYAKHGDTEFLENTESFFACNMAVLLRRNESASNVRSYNFNFDQDKKELLTQVPSSA